MGLEAVEIVMAVEDAFDIRIEDSEAEKVLTPRQLIDLVMSKVALTNSDVCLTQRAFNLLRGFCIRTWVSKRVDITPEAELRKLLPAPKRRAFAEQMANSLAIPTPTLVRPQWLIALLFLTTCLAGVVAAVTAVHANINFWAPTLLAFAATGYVGAKATHSLRRDFPRELSTVGDLARWIMSHKHDLALSETKAWTCEQIAIRVREIVVNVLGCENTYREDALFVQELGMG